MAPARIVIAASVVQQAPALPKPAVRAVAVGPLIDGQQLFVGGVPIGPSPPEPPAAPQEKRKRGADKNGTKRQRRCGRCVDREKTGGGDPTKCEGVNTRMRERDGKLGRQRCEFWDSTDDEEDEVDGLDGGEGDEWGE